MTALQLVEPSLATLSGFVDALERGWSRDNIGLEKTIRSDLAWIARDPSGFVASLDDVEAKGAPASWWHDIPLRNDDGTVRGRGGPQPGPRPELQP